MSKEKGDSRKRGSGRSGIIPGAGKVKFQAASFMGHNPREEGAEYRLQWGEKLVRVQRKKDERKRDTPYVQWAKIGF